MGDGYTSSFKEVLEGNPCSKRGIVPEKVEFVAHVQKWLGTRLWNKKNEGKSLLGETNLSFMEKKTHRKNY